MAYDPQFFVTANEFFYIHDPDHGTRQVSLKLARLKSKSGERTLGKRAIHEISDW